MEPKSMFITIFEGPDCCGKTTQANKLLTEINYANKQERRIYVHFPRVHYNEVKNLYKNTIETIYNDTFMQDLFLTDITEDNEDDKKYNYELLKRILVENVTINADEKISFLKSIYMIKKGFIKNESGYIDLLLDEWCRQSETYKMCIQKDNIIEHITSNNIKEFINDENGILPLHFIFDRFDYSGLCYNVFIIQKTLETFKNKNNSAKIDELIFMLNKIQDEKTKEIEEWKLLLEALDVRIRYVFFKPSEEIEKKVKKEEVRETNDYDRCNYISEGGKKYFENLTSMLHYGTLNIRNSIIIDPETEICREPNQLKCQDNINNKISDFIYKSDKYYRTEFENHVKTYNLI